MVGEMPTREFSKPTFRENRRPDDSTHAEGDMNRLVADQPFVTDLDRKRCSGDTFRLAR